jgi:uncharacterized integral membrane protein
MRQLLLILIAVLVGLWISAIAIFAVQNATLVSLQFLTARSIQLPLGVVLAFAGAIGLIVGMLVQTALLSGSNPTE